MYYFDKDFLGTKHHVVVTADDITESPVKPTSFLAVDGTTNPGTVGAFLKLIHADFDIIPPAIKVTLEQCNIPLYAAGLSNLMRDTELSAILADYRQKMNGAFDIAGNYVPIYLQNLQILNSCERIEMNKEISDISACQDKLCEKIIYDTALTKTGRMKVVSGPNVLTMHKSFKNDIKSKFSDGHIVEIDYSALEPRVALAIAGSSMAWVDDVYLEIGSALGIFERNVAKQVIISFLYGAGMRTISSLAGLKQEKLEPKLTELKKMVNYDNRLNQIKFEIQSTGFFRNHLGRPLLGVSDKAGTLFNNFCQSSAVDVALSGFSLLRDRMDQHGLRSTYLCFIHDAVVLDVPKDEMEILRNISEKMPTYLGVEFPTRLTILNS